MTAIDDLIAEGKDYASRRFGTVPGDLAHRLADALETEHHRANTATTTGERILADALRYRTAIEDALKACPSLVHPDPARKVDQVVGILARALKENT